MMFTFSMINITLGNVYYMSVIHRIYNLDIIFTFSMVVVIENFELTCTT